MQEAPQAEPPRALRVRPHAAAGGPMLGRAAQSAAHIRRGRHLPNTAVRKVFSTAWLLGWWTGRDAGWAGHVPRRHIPPPQAEPTRRAAAGRRPDRLGRGQDRPVQALRARKKGDAGEKLREKKRRLKAGGVQQRMGQACGWRSQRRAESRKGNRRVARRVPC